MKKLNRTEAEILAGRMLKEQVNGAVANAQNKPEIKSTLATAKKLQREWGKAERASEIKENAFKKYISENKILIEGDFGDIILKEESNYNYQVKKWERTISVNISSSDAVKEKLKEEILYQQIDSENLEQLEVKVIKAIRSYKSQKLLA